SKAQEVTVTYISMPQSGSAARPAPQGKSRLTFSHHQTPIRIVLNRPCLLEPFPLATESRWRSACCRTT
ncbi:MAG: hypothetical protein MOB07_21615, partial [Acidobacteria bacterium]|nr:hypothetical protein [Acidobacteriota bacterium]